MREQLSATSLPSQQMLDRGPQRVIEQVPLHHDAVMSMAPETQPEPKPSEWLRERLGAVASWGNDQRQIYTNEDDRKRRSEEWSVWHRNNDVSALVADALHGDKAARPALLEYIHKAEPIELASTDLNDLWSQQGFRGVVYNKIATAASRMYIEKNGFDIGEKALIAKTFARFGLSAEAGRDIWDAWLSFETTYANVPTGASKGDADPQRVNRFSHMVRRHLRTMEHIFNSNPRGLKTLYERDGIRNFGRYEPYELARQSWSHPGKPNQVAIVAASDWNGAMTPRDKTQDRYANGSRRYKQRTRYIEAANKSELRGRLDAIADEHGPIENLVIDVHANAESLVLGRRRDGIVFMSDVRGTADQPALFDNTIIARGADILLLGCSAGAQDGIASELAKSTRSHVTASEGQVIGVRRTWSGNRKIITDDKGSNTVGHGMGRLRARATRIADRLRHMKLPTTQLK